MIDLHVHYAMHVSPPEPIWSALPIWSKRGRASFMDRWDAVLLAGFNRLLNYESARSGPRVTIDGMRRGGLDVALSVLCTPFHEVGNHVTQWYSRKPPYATPPEDRYLDVLMRQLSAVESRLARCHHEHARIARSPAELDQVRSAGKLALVHCVEGGLSLGARPDSIERAVKLLASQGVAYVTIAHLFWRRVATNVPSLPFMSDNVYKWGFPQPTLGLSELGRAAIRAMTERGVLVDITHMSRAALEDTFILMDELDPARSVPLLASHCGFRFGRREYNLARDTVSRIAERDGVIGLMLSPHFMADGFPAGRPTSWEQSFELLCKHIDEIHAITGSHRHVAVGSDLDGFIKPTLAGFEDSTQLRRLGPALEHRYGRSTAEDIASGNALRVLRAGWLGA